MGTAEAVRRAAQGDQTAWDTLVERFTGLLWWIARGYGLTGADAADVVQTAWFRLVERLDTLQDPDHVGAWLATTTRRECLKLMRSHSRVRPTADECLDATEATEPPDAAVLDRERDALLWAAIDRLPERRRHLIRALMADPPPSYDELSHQLDIPVGSIGPTRARCLQQLREQLEAAGVAHEPEPVGVLHPRLPAATVSGPPAMSA